MRSGLLWYDKQTGQDLFGAVDRAAARYQDKFGTAPNVAYVNQAQLAEFAEAHRAEFPKTRLMLYPKETILRDHIWLGQQDTPPQDDSVLLERAQDAARNLCVGDCDEHICARCHKAITVNADYEFVKFPPVAARQTEGDTFFYHRKCFRDDGSTNVEPRARGFQPD